MLVDNGYTDLVVAISPDVEENQARTLLSLDLSCRNITEVYLFQDVIEQIKQLMTAASRELLTASRHRAYFRQVKILLPRTWTSLSYDHTLQGETFMDAEIRVDR